MTETMASPTDQFAERLFTASLATAEVMSVYLGDRLGWYRALATKGPATPADLVARAGGDERYAREWLEQQASYGILTVDADGRFALPAGAAEVLTDETSLSYLAPLVRFFCAAGGKLPQLVEAYRAGGGVSWAEFGVDMREAQADMNRPIFERELAGALASVPDVDAVLRKPGARIADVACGAGWSSVALARAYPEAVVDGFDVDEPSIALAHNVAADAGLGNRVTFRHVDAADLGENSYDAIFVFEAVHDMSQPVEVLAAIRRALTPGGLAIVMDEAVRDRFETPGDDAEKLMYGFSVLACLPDGMAHQPSAATGTVMRPDTLRGYAREAGFRDATTLPIDDFGFFRFYRLA